MILTKQTIVESYKYDSLIRKIVKDIVTLYKEKGAGEYYLPEDIDENEFEYHFKDIFVTVELILEESKNVDGFLLNADYYSDDDDGEDVVIVKIVYNPETKNKILYDMIGELNEILAHELRHNYQKNKGLFDFNVEPNDGETDRVLVFVFVRVLVVVGVRVGVWVGVWVFVGVGVTNGGQL